MSSEDAQAWIEREQILLWDALDNDLRRSIPAGGLSISAANTAQRIIGAARLVGASSAGAIPWRLVAAGIYTRILEIGGIEPVEMPEDEAEWKRLEHMMFRYGGTREQARHDVARALEDLTKPSEIAYIRDEASS